MKTAFLRIGSIVLLLLGVVILFGVIEFGLSITSLFNRATDAEQSLLIPEQHRVRPIPLRGVYESYYYGGKLHVKNNHNMRAYGDYVRREGTRNFIVVGDSSTYGQAIGVNEVYPSLLEKQISILFPDDIFCLYNLGVRGANSTEILGIAEFWLPILRPERILYGINLNDYLRRKKSQTSSGNGNGFLPQIKSLPIFKSKLVGLITQGYEQFQLYIGLKPTMEEQNRWAYEKYRHQFAQELSLLNDLSLNSTKHPLLVIVLENVLTSKNIELAKLTENLAREVGAEVISSIDIVSRKFKGKEFVASKWDAHPNAEINQNWADIIVDYLSTSDFISKDARQMPRNTESRNQLANTAMSMPPQIRCSTQVKTDLVDTDDYSYETSAMVYWTKEGKDSFNSENSSEIHYIPHGRKSLELEVPMGARLIRLDPLDHRASPLAWNVEFLELQVVQQVNFNRKVVFSTTTLNESSVIGLKEVSVSSKDNRTFLQIEGPDPNIYLDLTKIPSIDNNLPIILKLDFSWQIN